MMISDKDFKRVGWHSRRGMLELDLILMPFVQQTFATLDTTDQQRYIALLREEDTDIFRWLLRAEEPDDADLRRIVRLILGAHDQR